MEDDWDENHITGVFRLNMTNYYIPNSGFCAPNDYGIVVVDYQTNTVLNLHGYTEFGMLYASEVDLAFDKRYHDIYGQRKERLQAIFEKGIVKEYEHFNKKTKKIEIREFAESLEKVLKKLKKGR